MPSRAWSRPARPRQSADGRVGTLDGSTSARPANYTLSPLPVRGYVEKLDYSTWERIPPSPVRVPTVPPSSPLYLPRFLYPPICKGGIGGRAKVAQGAILARLALLYPKPGHNQGSSGLVGVARGQPMSRGQGAPLPGRMPLYMPPRGDVPGPPWGTCSRMPPVQGWTSTPGHAMPYDLDTRTG